MGSKAYITLKVGERLTKGTIVQELARAETFFNRLPSRSESAKIYVDFENVSIVDTLAVVYIVQIERFIFTNFKNLKIVHLNIPAGLISLLNLTSVARELCKE